MGAQAERGAVQVPFDLTLDDVAELNEIGELGRRFEWSREGVLSIMPPRASAMNTPRRGSAGTGWSVRIRPTPSQCWIWTPTATARWPRIRWPGCSTPTRRTT